MVELVSLDNVTIRAIGQPVLVYFFPLAIRVKIRNIMRTDLLRERTFRLRVGIVVLYKLSPASDFGSHVTSLIHAAPADAEADNQFARLGKAK